MVDHDPDQAKALAGSLADAADQAAQEARALLMSLREGQIDRPTVEVVNEVLADWQATTGISARLVDVARRGREPAVTEQMVAALREILHNIAKHAQAGDGRGRLTGDPERIELVVSDDGVGFDVDRAGAREADGHFGLRGLRERAEQVGGAVEISSEKRKGTTVRWTAQRHWTA